MSDFEDDVDIEIGGQSEPLTQRINRLLEEYSDGLAIPKELVQNADDAGATEVHLIYDKRQQSGDSSKLLDPKMIDLQGPALLAFNNAKFTEFDFHNLKKLGGATKQEDVCKVGRFGLGFNAVYNLTDVPFILSGNKLLILDPHSENKKEGYLTKQLKGLPATGLTMKLTAEKKEQFGDQLNAFHNLCGCDINATDDVMPGTLLRFPLRTAEQARVSKISKIQYDENSILSLFDVMQNQLDKLLLFTQSVQKFSVSIILENETTTTPLQLFSTEKKLETVFQKNDFLSKHPKVYGHQYDKPLLDHSSILNAASAIKLETNKNCKVDSVIMVKVVCIKNSLENIANSAESETCENYFLLSNTISTEKAFSMSKQYPEESLSPVGGIAIELVQQSQDKFMPIPVNMNESSSNAVTFCFLPIPIENPFQFHINGYFSVTSNRRELRKTTMDEKTNEWNPGKWNKVLIEEVILKALLNCLNTIAQNKIFDPENWHQIWPCFSSKHSVWQPLSTAFISLVKKSPQPAIFYSKNTGDWFDYNHTAYLESKLNGTTLLQYIKTDINQQLKGNLLAIKKQPLGIIEVNSDVFLELFRSEQNTIRGSFILSMFFKHLDLFSPQVINDIVIECLKAGETSSNINLMFDANAKKEMKKSKCILANGIYQKPIKLIDPNSEQLSKLYEESDCRFPDQIYHSQVILNSLKLLGMKTFIKDFEWTNILGRINKIENISGSKFQQAKELSNDIIKIILQKGISNCPKQIETEISLKKFLFSENDFENHSFYSGSQMFNSKLNQLVDYVAPVFDITFLQGSFKHKDITNLCDFLGIKNNVSEETVLSQLSTISTKIGLSENVDMVDVRRCDKIYNWFSSHKKVHEIKELFCERTTEKLIVTPHGFKESNMVVQDERNNCEPWLFSLHVGINRKKCEGFLKALSIPNYTTSDVLIEILNKIKTKYKDNPLENRDKEIVIEILNNLQKQRDKFDINLVYALDIENRLQKCSTLYYNRIESKTDANSFEVSRDLSPQLLKFLSIPDMAEKIFKNHLVPRPKGAKEFGQRVNLVTRLKNVLVSYPRDYGIFKELIQNADDAKATKIHFIIDKRELSCKNILHESWIKAQGPALLVYNNQTFSEEDLEGIQDVGLGSKGNDPNKIGQYGIGFDSVYHITDVPSFLSDNKVLCIMDPLCKYVPGADKYSPGMKLDPNSDWKETYQDVYEGYLPTIFSLEGGTMFRFPLRSEKNELGQPISIQDIENFRNCFSFQGEMSLLFLKNLRQIKFSTIEDHNLDPKEEVTFNLEITKEVKGSFHSFVKKCFNYNIEIKKDFTYIQQIPLNHLLYYAKTSTKTLTFDSSTDWMVVHGFGMQKNIQLDFSVLGKIKDDNLNLTPTVGIAVSLHDWQTQHINGNLFCFLPMPVQTKLPFHINGHFVIESSRRSLWQSTHEKAPRAEWNNYLLFNLVPHCLIQVMNEIKNIEHANNLFWKLFPLQNQLDDPWSSVASGFCSLVAKENLSIFPLKLKRDFLSWVSIMDSLIRYNGEVGFICDSLTPELTEILIEIGIPIVSIPTIVNTQEFLKCFSFPEVSTKPLKIKPHNLMKLLKSAVEFKSKLPLKVEDTPFQRASTVKELISYLYKTKTEDTSTSLCQLPLNVTQDGYLRVFDDKVYCTEYADMFFNSGRLFAHQSIAQFMFENKIFTTSTESDVFKKFSLDDFIQTFKTEFPDYAKDQIMIPIKHEKWIERAWNFISCHITESRIGSRVYIHPSLNENKSFFASATCLSLVPVTVGEVDQQIMWNPISDVRNVLHSAENSYFSKLYKRKGGLILALSNNVLTKLVAKEEKPSSMIQIFNKSLSQNSSENDYQDIEKILEYLNYKVNDIKTTDWDKIKKLPIFQRIDNSFVNIVDQEPLVIIGCGLTEELENLNTTKIVFLKQKVYEKLYDALGCKKIDEFEFYSRFILPAYSYLSLNKRQSHLDHLSQMLNSLKLKLRLTNSEENFKKDLTTAKLVEISGNFYNSQLFYDHNITLFFEFGKITEIIHLLPQDYRKGNWYELMKHNGLIIDCKNTISLKMCHEIKNIQHDKKVFLVTVLLSFIFYQNKSNLNDDFLSELAECHFLVDECHPEKHPLCFKNSVLPKFETICFTSCNVLPTYALKAVSSSHYLNCLKIKQKPSISDVILHLNNIIEKNYFNYSEKPLIKRNEILMEIYKYLSIHIDEISDEDHDKLSRLPYILVKDKNALVFPKQVVQVLEEEACPFIYPCITELWGYMALFLKQGATKRISLDQYALSLKLLKNLKNANENMEQEKTQISLIMTKIVQLLREGKQFINTKTLFLLSKASLFSKSISLFIADDSLTISDTMALWTGSLTHDEIKCLFSNLPDNLKPQSVRASAEETISYSNECDAVLSCRGQLMVSTMLRSIEFRECIVRLVINETSLEGQEVFEKITDLFLSSLTQCVKRIHAEYQVQNGSVSEFEKCINFEFKKGILHIIITHNFYTDPNFFNKLGDILNEIFKVLGINFDSSNIMKLAFILNKPRKEMHHILDLERIEPWQSSIEKTETLFSLFDEIGLDKALEQNTNLQEILQKILIFLQKFKNDHFDDQEAYLKMCHQLWMFIRNKNNIPMIHGYENVLKNEFKNDLTLYEEHHQNWIEEYCIDELESFSLSTQLNSNEKDQDVTVLSQFLGDRGQSGKEIPEDLIWMLFQTKISRVGQLEFVPFFPSDTVGIRKDEAYFYAKVKDVITSGVDLWNNRYDILCGSQCFSVHYTEMFHFHDFNSISITYPINDYLAKKQVQIILSKADLLPIKSCKQVYRLIVESWNPKYHPQDDSTAKIMFQFVIEKAKNSDIVSDHLIKDWLSSSDKILDLVHDLVQPSANLSLEKAVEKKSVQNFLTIAYQTYFHELPLFYKPEAMTCASFGTYKPWLKQAYYDRDSVKTESFNCWVTYKCFQAVEKLLKAVLIKENSICSSQLYTHNLINLRASIINKDVNSKLINPIHELTSLLKNDQFMRYPQLNSAPCSNVSQKMAESSKELINSIFKIIEDCCIFD